MTLVRLSTLSLREGDAVVTPKGTMLVLARLEDVEHLDVLWLETSRRVQVWWEDPVYGPVEVLRRGA